MAEASNQEARGAVTRLLVRARDGDRDAFDRLFPLVYDHLRRMAERRLRGERAGHTLQPTALVHEAYVKLVEGPSADWRNRAHFYGIAARAMRQILIDHARKKGTRKRGGDWQRTSMPEGLEGTEMPVEELLALDDALERLGRLDDRLRQVVELRFFAGLPETEIAELLHVSERTVERDWAKARAWLHKELYPDRTDPDRADDG